MTQVGRCSLVFRVVRGAPDVRGVTWRVGNDRPGRDERILGRPVAALGKGREERDTRRAGERPLGHTHPSSAARLTEARLCGTPPRSRPCGLQAPGSGATGARPGATSSADCPADGRFGGPARSRRRRGSGSRCCCRGCGRRPLPSPAGAPPLPRELDPQGRGDRTPRGRRGRAAEPQVLTPAPKLPHRRGGGPRAPRRPGSRAAAQPASRRDIHPLWDPSGRDAGETQRERREGWGRAEPRLARQDARSGEGAVGGGRSGVFAKETGRQLRSGHRGQ